jgi:hypothetical protein
MDWFRHYHGCVFNPKWRTVARRTGATLERVAFVWSSLLEHASSQQGEERGSVATWDPEIVADHLMCDVTQLKAIYIEMVEVGSIVQDRLEGWPRRQFTSDSSAERVRRHRAAKRLNGQDTDPGVTPCNVTSAFGNAPEQSRTDSEQIRTDSESEHSTSSPAESHDSHARAHEAAAPPGDDDAVTELIARVGPSGASPAQVRGMVRAWDACIPPPHVRRLIGEALMDTEVRKPIAWVNRRVGLVAADMAPRTTAPPEEETILDRANRMLAERAARRAAEEENRVIN